ncbi:MAG: PQ-loop domain-containing transporter [Candidatus Saccharimonadales bacterium]
MSIIAYLPQIIHLVKERCSAGISRTAFGMWVISSALVTFHAVVIFDYVFIVLGAIQIITSLIIYVFGKMYQNGVCAWHALAISARLTIYPRHHTLILTEANRRASSVY